MLFTAGEVAPVQAVLRRLAAMRSYLRDVNLGGQPDESIPASVGMTGAQLRDMYRLLALAKYAERYVIPSAHTEQAHSLDALATGCSLAYEGGPGMTEPGPGRPGVIKPRTGRPGTNGSRIGRPGPGGGA